VEKVEGSFDSQPPLDASQRQRASTLQAICTKFNGTSRRRNSVKRDNGKRKDGAGRHFSYEASSAVQRPYDANLVENGTFLR
jgi:hypothetical protein